MPGARLVSSARHLLRRDLQQSAYRVLDPPRRLPHDGRRNVLRWDVRLSHCHGRLGVPAGRLMPQRGHVLGRDVCQSAKILLDSAR